MNNYINKRALEESNAILFDKIGTNFVKINKFDTTIESIKEDYSIINATVDVLMVKN
jgi:hypothetical protein